MATAWRCPPDIFLTRARPGFRLKFLEQRCRAVDHCLLVEHPDRPETLLDLAAEKDILRGGQVIGKRQVLINDLDPLGAGLGGLVEVANLTVHDNFAVARREIPGYRLDHGRLAGAVVSHQTHDFAPLHLEADVGQSPDGTEILGNVANLKHWHRGPPRDNIYQSCPGLMQGS